MHGRIAMHSFATAVGTAGAVGVLRMEIAAPSWLLLFWYFGFFGAAHILMIPVLAGWFAMRTAVERRIHAVVERELIRVDLRNYQNTLERVFPHVKAPSDDDRAS